MSLGSTAISLGVLLASFMGGLCLGSYFLPRYAGTHTHPLRVYAAIEIGIGACGLLVLWLLPLMARIYFASEAAGLPSMLLRGLLAALCLLPPTILMGASLPAIVRWIRGSAEGVTWWGYLYGGNTAGAVLDPVMSLRRQILRRGLLGAGSGGFNGCLHGLRDR